MRSFKDHRNQWTPKGRRESQAYHKAKRKAQATTLRKAAQGDPDALAKVTARLARRVKKLTR